MTSLLVFGILYTPNRYILTESNLIINRYLRNIRIPLKTINDIRLFTDSDKKGHWFTCGTQVAFGNWGIFKTSIHKKLYVYTRRDNNWVIIITSRKKYVIAPDDLNLLEAVQKQLEMINSSEATVQSENAEIFAKGKWWPKIIPFLIVGGTFLLLYLGYREPRIECSAEKLKVQHPWGISLPVEEIAQVDTVAWKEMPPITLRTNGISLFGVNRGSFKTNAGEKVRLSVKCGVSPVIRITDKEGKQYFINRKNPAETRACFLKVKEKLEINK
jgi:hypothetical protein